MLQHTKLTEISTALGITHVGVSRAEPLESTRLDEWLQRGYQGTMAYMERNIEKRLSPAVLLPGAQSVISIFVNYHQSEKNQALEGVISKYAHGADYHFILKDLLHELGAKLLEAHVVGLSRRERAKVYRVFVDSAPVMEKEWAVRAGIGWLGKHGNVISKTSGSWGFLGEIITTITFDQYNQVIPDHCGTCTACIDACPTAAIVEPYVVDGSKCISYATIELNSEEEIPDEIADHMGSWIFGCDICQDVCPWNRFAQQSAVQEFIPLAVLAAGAPDFSQMADATFDREFSRSPLARPGLQGLKRNQKLKL